MPSGSPCQKPRVTITSFGVAEGTRVAPSPVSFGATGVVAVAAAGSGIDAGAKAAAGGVVVSAARVGVAGAAGVAEAIEAAGAGAISGVGAASARRIT